MNDQGDQSSQRLAPLVVDEVNRAYYSELLAAPDRARTRALNASTIATAVAAAIVAAGVAGGFERLPVWVGAIGFATVLLWVAAAGAYLSAVAGPARANDDGEDGTESGSTGQEGTAEAALRSANRKIRATEVRLALIQRRTTMAYRLTIAALAATALVLGLSAFGPTREREEHATVVLSAEGARQVAQVCGPERNTVRALVDPAALTDEFVRLTLSPPACPESDVRLRSQLIVAVSFED